MLVVRIELWPRGDRSLARTLGIAKLTNVGGDRSRGNYQVQLFGAGSSRRKTALPDEPWKSQAPRQQGYVDGFARQSRNAWDLLLEGLLVAMADRLPARLRHVR